MPVETYLSQISFEMKEKIQPIISYIEENYKEAVFDEKYSDKTYIPTWRLNGKYVAIGCRKNYISVYFASIEAVEMVKSLTNSKYIIARKGCVNFGHQLKELPYEAIFKGIDICFSI